MKPHFQCSPIDVESEAQLNCLPVIFCNFPLSAARRTTHKKKDLHFHGCVGSDISDHDLEGIRKMAAYELKSGITAICPATINPARELGI